MSDKTTKDRNVAVPPELSVVIPCFNEEQGVDETLSALFAALDDAARPYEIICVDDGSSDGTPRELERFGDRIRVLRNDTNKGYGASLKRGFRAARGAAICIVDADGSYPVTDIPRLYAALRDGSFDMVVGARTGDKVSLPLVRRPAKWILGKLANYVAGDTIPDMNSGLRVFPRAIGNRMIDILPDGFSLTTTITLALLSSGYSVHYLPIDYHRRIGRSKIRPIRDTLNFLQLIAKMALYFAPLKVFIPLSLMLLASGVIWGCVSYWVFGELADVSTLAIVMTAVQTGAIGLLAELIRWRVPSKYEQP